VAGRRRFLCVARSVAAGFCRDVRRGCAAAATGAGSLPPRTEADGADEVVDLAVSLPVDDTARLALRGATCSPRESTALVPVLHRIDVPEITRQAVQLGPGGAHDDASSLVARSVRMILSTMERS